MHCIRFGDKEYRHINFNIDSRSDLGSIYQRIGELEIPGLKLERDLFFHSITELINNSICAHREKQVAEPVRLRFSIEDEHLVITIKDRGRGFDVQELPYNLDDPVSAIDINGRNFQIYREKYNYKRFGTGLFNAKKIFDRFSLDFVDNKGNIIPHDSEIKDGTIIKLQVELQ